MVLFALNPGQKSTYKASVVRVVDGDTVIVEMEGGQEERVRLLLIDTPESVDPNKELQPFGLEAKEFLEKTLKEGGCVELEIGENSRDQYERLLAYIWLDNENINKKIVQEGFARVAYVYPPNTKYLTQFKIAQKSAQKRKINIWSLEDYVKNHGFDPSAIQYNFRYTFPDNLV